MDDDNVTSGGAQVCVDKGGLSVEVNGVLVGCTEPNKYWRCGCGTIVVAIVHGDMLYCALKIRVLLTRECPLILRRKNVLNSASL